VSWGAVLETLTEADFSVFLINPKQVDRFRDCYTVAGAKDDSRDALVLASALRTDRKSFKRVQADTSEITRLRELSRLDEELKNELRRATSLLRVTQRAIQLPDLNPKLNGLMEPGDFPISALQKH